MKSAMLALAFVLLGSTLGIGPAEALDDPLLGAMVLYVPTPTDPPLPADMTEYMAFCVQHVPLPTYYGGPMYCNLLALSPVTGGFYPQNAPSGAGPGTWHLPGMGAP